MAALGLKYWILFPSMNSERVDNVRSCLSLHSWELFSLLNCPHTTHLFQQWLLLSFYHRDLSHCLYFARQGWFVWQKALLLEEFSQGAKNCNCTWVLEEWDRSLLSKHPLVLLTLNIGLSEVSQGKVSCRFAVCLKKKHLRDLYWFCWDQVSQREQESFSQGESHLVKLVHTVVWCMCQACIAAASLEKRTQYMGRLVAKRSLAKMLQICLISGEDFLYHHKPFSS